MMLVYLNRIIMHVLLSLLKRNPEKPKTNYVYIIIKALYTDC